MYSLFHPNHPDHSVPLAVEPVAIVFPKIEGADIAAATLGEPVAGDLYDSIRVSPERVLFGLLDVAGRRENNRGILSAAQEVFRKLGVELFSRADINESDAMTELCLHLNRRLIEASTGVHSCPAFIGCYHEKFGTLCYTNAGHTPGLLRDGTGIVELPSTGLPLGLFSHATCEAPTVGMEKGAALLLVSRGAVDCVDGKCKPETEGGLEDGSGKEKSAEEFGLERVKQVLASSPSVPAQPLCASILQAVGEFNFGSVVADDRTALALVRTA